MSPRASSNIPARRLVNQHIASPFRGGVGDLVADLGAVQAQEFPFAKWGLGLRLRATVEDADIERAFADGEILRTHVLRPTWHFVAAEDLGWMLDLTAPRIHLSMRTFMRHTDLDVKRVSRAAALIERTLAGRRFRTRRELRTELARARLVFTPMQMMGVALFAELEQVICSGPRRGKDFTYGLVSERVARPRRLTADEALALLTARFFASHGPATLKDFVWWSGLKTADARRGLDLAAMNSREQGGLVYWHHPDASRATRASGVQLLPIYDEYLVAYRDRVAVPHGPGRILSGSRVIGFRHALVIDGQVTGTWTLRAGRGETQVEVTPIRRLTGAQRDRLDAMVSRYSRFLAIPLQTTVRPAGDPV